METTENDENRKETKHEIRSKRVSYANLKSKMSIQAEYPFISIAS